VNHVSSTHCIARLTDHFSGPRRFELSAAGGALACALLLSACGGGPPPGALSPADSAARADSIAAALAAARRDSMAAAARRDSIAAAARADSIARVERERARADSVRAQVLAGDTAGMISGASPSGLDAERAATLAAPIHFDFDRSDLRPEAITLLDQKVAILRSAPLLEIVIEGHCDERGSDEYNLALGNRRAAAAKRYLVEHGIADSRITIVSFGEERPVDPRHSEEAWAANRRSEFVVTRGAR
jgi:peptidoglycan-associated lipoprotein